LADIAIGLHGGCGTLARGLLSEADWSESRMHLALALRAGWRVLSADGSALDAVQAAVVVLEDSPHFNAGHGAALNEASEHELDAAIMDGASLAAGASIVCAPGCDLNRFFAWLTAFQPTWYSAVPTMHQAILIQTQRETDRAGLTPARR
jgi:hypothetical protein